MKLLWKSLPDVFHNMFLEFLLKILLIWLFSAVGIENTWLLYLFMTYLDNQFGTFLALQNNFPPKVYVSAGN